jgi:predicted permease
LNSIETLFQDLRYGLRQLRRSPGFAAVAVITLALGIAANTTIFSMVSEALLRRLPVHDPDRVVMVSTKNMFRGRDLQPASALDFQAWQEQNHVFKDMAAGNMQIPFTLSGSGEPESLLGDAVTPNYFSVLGVFPALGRAFLPSEGEASRDHVVILSNKLWHQRYGGNPHAIGQAIRLNGAPYTVVGVMPPGTDTMFSAPRLWTPLAFTSKDLAPSARQNRYLHVYARLKPGVTVRQAQAEMASIARRLAQAHPKSDKGWSLTVLTLQKFLVRSRGLGPALAMLMLTVVFVLLISCANIAGLLLARGAAREHEMAIRTAVGASRLRLARQMLAESLLIAVAGGAIGLLVSVWGIHLLRAGLNFNTLGGMMAAGLHLDKPTLVFTVAISFFTVVIFGLAPALRSSEIDLTGGLKEGGRMESGGRRRSKLRNVFVVGEIALALILLAGAGIMMRDFVHGITGSNGFNPNHVTTAEIQLNSRNYSSPAEQISFFQRVTTKLKQLPGIQEASATSNPPLNGAPSISFSIEGQPPLPRSKRPLANYIVAGPGYFRTMQIPLLRGRSFSQSDSSHSPLVAVANEEFARRFYPKGDAIGQRIRVDTHQPAWAEIVGIVGNVTDYPGQLSPSAQIYESYLQAPQSDMFLVVRSPLALSVATPTLRHAVWFVDKDQPVGGGMTGGVMTMKELANLNEGGGRTFASLLAIFAALALVLAGVGIYGVVAYSVSQRTHEIGIRTALGAQRRDVLRLVLWQGGLLMLIGCAIGLALALPLPKLFSALFGLGPQGPLIAISVCIVVAIVSLLATYVPARRAAKVDPMVALRYE